MTYRIEFHRLAQAELNSLPRKIQLQIIQKIEPLKDNPRPPACKKLENSPEYYRIRSGDYRIIYQIEDNILLVLIIRIAHRREVYRRLP